MTLLLLSNLLNLLTFVNFGHHRANLCQE